MKIHELVERYKKNERIDIAKAIETKQYIGIDTKRRIAQLVLENCTEVVDDEIRIDSVERYILFIITVIMAHTNLEFKNEEDEEYSSIDDYDMLCESGLLVKVIDTFKDDYASCQEILNMMTADIMQGNMTIEKKIGKFLDEIQDLLSGVVSGLVEKLNVDELMENLPFDQAKLLNLFDSVK